MSDFKCSFGAEFCIKIALALHFWPGSVIRTNFFKFLNFEEIYISSKKVFIPYTTGESWSHFDQFYCNLNFSWPTIHRRKIAEVIRQSLPRAACQVHLEGEKERQRERCSGGQYSIRQSLKRCDQYKGINKIQHWTILLELYFKDLRAL